MPNRNRIAGVPRRRRRAAAPRPRAEEDEVPFLHSRRLVPHIIDLTAEMSNVLTQENEPVVPVPYLQRAPKNVEQKRGSSDSKRLLKEKAPKKSKKIKIKHKEEEGSNAILCLKCRTHYNSAPDGLHTSRCGHIYCKECADGLTKCIKCNMKIGDLWKVL